MTQIDAEVASTPGIRKPIVAIVGRPNVGKSTLFNRLIGGRRAIVEDIPGTTRDRLYGDAEWKDHAYSVIDTGGLEPDAKEGYSVLIREQVGAMEAVERSDVVVLVLDGTEKVAHQDQTLAGEVAKAYKGLVVAVNKWDLAEDTEEWRDTIAHRVLTRLRFTPWAPMAFISAKTRLNIDGLLDLVMEVQEARGQRIATAEVNSVLRKAVAEHPPASSGRKPVRLKYATQAGVNPPTFVIFCNDASMVHFSYRRYLENAFRRAWGFEGTAIKLEFRSRAE